MRPKAAAATFAGKLLRQEEYEQVAILIPDETTSLQELRKATGWRAHSVRGFLSGAVKKKMGLRIDSAPREDGERAYRLASK